MIWSDQLFVEEITLIVSKDDDVDTNIGGYHLFVTTHWPEPPDKVIISVASQSSSWLDIYWRGKPLGHRHQSRWSPLANLRADFWPYSQISQCWWPRARSEGEITHSLPVIHLPPLPWHSPWRIHQHPELNPSPHPKNAQIIIGADINARLGQWTPSSPWTLCPPPPSCMWIQSPVPLPITQAAGGEHFLWCTNLLHLHQHQRWWSDHNWCLCVCKVTPLLHIKLLCGCWWHQKGSFSCLSWFDTHLAQAGRLDCSHKRYHWLGKNCNWQIPQTALQQSPPWCHWVCWHVIRGIQWCNKASRQRNSPSRPVQVQGLVPIQS